jgi:hypothetical protein
MNNEIHVVERLKAKRHKTRNKIIAGLTPSQKAAQDFENGAGTVTNPHASFFDRFDQKKCEF